MKPPGQLLLEFMTQVCNIFSHRVLLSISGGWPKAMAIAYKIPYIYGNVVKNLESLLGPQFVILFYTICLTVFLPNCSLFIEPEQHMQTSPIP